MSSSNNTPSHRAHGWGESDPGFKKGSSVLSYSVLLTTRTQAEAQVVNMGQDDADREQGLPALGLIAPNLCCRLTV